MGLAGYESGPTWLSELNGLPASLHTERNPLPPQTSSSPSRSTLLEVQATFGAARIQFGPWSTFRYLFGLAPMRWRGHRARQGRQRFRPVDEEPTCPAAKDLNSTVPLGGDYADD